MRLRWPALEGIHDEAALASFRRNQGNVVVRARIPGEAALATFTRNQANVGECGAAWIPS